MNRNPIRVLNVAMSFQQSNIRSQCAVDIQIKKARPVYLVRADILGSSEHILVSAVMMQGEPVRRRINRLERATESYCGKVIRRASQGFLSSFESAEAAVMGACEMQRRCAVIPKMSGVKVGVQIGINAGAALQFSEDNTGAIEATAARLAALLGDGGIMASEAVFNALSPLTRKNSLHTPCWSGNACACHRLAKRGDCLDFRRFR